MKDNDLKAVADFVYEVGILSKTPRSGLWFLGTGIIFGAVWADYSWGRPWGWDPKETFALVTWLVYLIIVHLRFVSPKYRSDWTAWLSIVGFAVMMFNWIGVNFFLVGLHSYA